MLIFFFGGGGGGGLTANQLKDSNIFPCSLHKDPTYPYPHT